MRLNGLGVTRSGSTVVPPSVSLTVNKLITCDQLLLEDSKKGVDLRKLSHMTPIVQAIKHSTKNDTLQNQINSIAHQVDSLSKVTAHNSAAIEFFHDIINMDVATFVMIVSVIIVVAGYISWTLLTNRFRVERQQLTNEFNAIVATHNNHFSELTAKLENDIVDLAKNHEVLSHESKRAVYELLRNSNHYILAVIFGLEAIQSMIKVDDLEEAEYFFRIMNSHVLDKDFKKDKVDYYGDKFKSLINFIREKDIPELKKFTDDLEKKYMSVIYNIDAQTNNEQQAE